MSGRPRHALSALIALTAIAATGCPDGTEAPTANPTPLLQDGLRPWGLPGLMGGAAEPTGSASTATGGLDAPWSGTGPTIRIDAGTVLHPASPYVNGVCRNHVFEQFDRDHLDPSAVEGLGAALQPRWGGTYLNGLAAAGYSASTSRPWIYRSGHGPTDGRTDYATMTGYHFRDLWDLPGLPSSWDGYPYDDFRYPLSEARAMGAELLVTVNFGTGTPDEAGALAGFLDDPSAPLRFAHPFSLAPFMVSDADPGAFMFEIGNEITLKTTRGHDKALSCASYVQAAAPFIQAIRQAAGRPVQIALDAAVNVYWGAGDQWDQQDRMIRSLSNAAIAQGVRFEALQYHAYPTYPVHEHLAGPAYAEQLFDQKLLPALASAPFPIEIWADELHAAASDTCHNTGMYGALFQADSTASALRLSLNGRQVIPVMADFALWHAGASHDFDALYFQDDDPSHLTPIYQFRRLLAENWGDFVVQTEAEGAGEWQDAGSDGSVTHVSNLDVVGAKSADGKTLYLLVINRSRGQDIAAQLAVQNFSPSASQVAIKRLEAPGLGWDAPWSDVLCHEDLSGDLRQPIVFPQASISFVVIH